MHLVCDNYGTPKHPIIQTWLAAHDDPEVFIWIKTAEQILNSLERLLHRTTGAGQWFGVDRSIAATDGVAQSGSAG